MPIRHYLIEWCRTSRWHTRNILEILTQRVYYIAAQIDIAIGRNRLPTYAAAASGGAVALETTHPSTAGASPTTAHHNGSGRVNNSSSVDYDEAVIESLKQSA